MLKYYSKPTFNYLKTTLNAHFVNVLMQGLCSQKTTSRTGGGYLKFEKRLKS